MQQLRLQTSKQPTSHVMHPNLCTIVVLLQRSNPDLVPEPVDGAELVVLEELLGCVHARHLLEDLLPAWMLVLVRRDVEDLPVDNDPQVLLRVVLAHLRRTDESGVCTILCSR